MNEGPVALKGTRDRPAIAIQSVEIRQVNGNIEVNLGKVNPMAFKEGDFWFIGWVSDTPLVIGGPIHDEQKLQELKAILETLNPGDSSFPININRLASVKNEWYTIKQEIGVLSKAGQILFTERKITQLFTGVEPIFSSVPPRNLPLSEIKTMREILKSINAHPLATYCSCFFTFLKSVFQDFKYDAVDTYTLERYIKDFEHEVGNPLLKKTVMRLIELEATLDESSGKNKLSYQEKLSSEKEIIVARGEIREMVSAHFEALKEIVRIIPLIESAHPRLKKVKACAMALKGLLDFETGLVDAKPLPLASEQILLQVLGDSLGQATVLSSNAGLERALLGFVLRASALQLLAHVRVEELIDLALNWEETNQKVHQAAFEKGIERFQEWRSLLKAPHFERRVDLLMTFWEYFLSNLNAHFSLVQQESSQGNATGAGKNVYFNQQLFDLMPPFLIERGKPSAPRFVNYQSEASSPVSLTEEGLHLFYRLKS